MANQTMMYPATSFVAVTTSDSVKINPVPKALFVGTGGNVSVRSPGSSTTVVFKNVASGQILDIRAEMVLTATTAADIVALY